MTYIEYLEKILDLSKGQRVSICTDIGIHTKDFLNVGSGSGPEENALKQLRQAISEFHQVERVIDNTEEEIEDYKAFADRRLKKGY